MTEDTTIVEHELVTNERRVSHSTFGDLVIRRPTPAMEVKIAEERRKIYHRDLKDPSVLTQKEVENLLEQRGVWSKERTERVRDLSIQSAGMMTQLTALGYKTATELYDEITQLRKEAFEVYSESSEEVQEALERAFDIQGELANADVSLLRKEAPSTDGLRVVQELENIHFKMKLLAEFSEVKRELNELLEDWAHFFGDTIESRAERAEKMAKVYFCITKSEDHSPILDSFADMWNMTPDEITWLSTQLFYFENGIDEAYGEVLQNFGFMARVIDTEESSESLHDHPASKPDGESPENELQNSSESNTPTN